MDGLVVGQGLGLVVDIDEGTGEVVFLKIGFEGSVGNGFFPLLAEEQVTAQGRQTLVVIVFQHIVVGDAVGLHGFVEFILGFEVLLDEFVQAVLHARLLLRCEGDPVIFGVLLQVEQPLHFRHRLVFQGVRHGGAVGVLHRPDGGDVLELAGGGLFPGGVVRLIEIGGLVHGALILKNGFGQGKVLVAHRRAAAPAGRKGGQKEAQGKGEGKKTDGGFFHTVAFLDPKKCDPVRWRSASIRPQSRKRGEKIRRRGRRRGASPPADGDTPPRCPWLSPAGCRRKRLR